MTRMVSSFAAITLPNSTAVLSLGAYLVLIAAAAFAGGSSIAFLSLGHRTMQVLLSLTGGVLLGVGLLHLLPHAWVQLDRDIDATMAWVLGGFFLMFLLERAFHGHAHHTADGGCDHGHDHGPAHAADAHPHAAVPAAGRWAWCGAFAGLALHSLADGAALAASVGADAHHGVGMLAGFATFLAILLHKPFDSGIIATLMIEAGASARLRRIVIAAYATVVPLGAVAFLASLHVAGPQQSAIVGPAMAMASQAQSITPIAIATLSNKMNAKAKETEGKLESAYGELSGNAGHQIQGKAKQVQASGMRTAEAVKDGTRSAARQTSDAADKVANNIK
jgi:zinc and cadmium transporter